MGRMQVEMMTDRGFDGKTTEQGGGDRVFARLPLRLFQHRLLLLLRVSTANKPPVRFELTTGGLQNRCATTAPQRQTTTTFLFYHIRALSARFRLKFSSKPVAMAEFPKLELAPARA